MQSEENYNNSRALNLHRTSGYAEVERAIAALLPKLYKNVPKAAVQPLKTLVMDLYEVHNIDPKRWLGHSRRADWYRKRPKRYNGLKLGGDTLVCLINRLRDNGFVDFRAGFRPAHKKGEHGKRQHDKYQRGRWSRMRATPKLIALLTQHSVQPYMAELCDCEEVIVLRSPKKTWIELKKQKDGTCKPVRMEQERGVDIDYADTEETRRMRKDLRLINERLSQHWIDLHIPDSDLPKLND